MASWWSLLHPMVVEGIVRQLGVLRLLAGQIAEGELAERLGVMRRKHQAEVIDARRRSSIPPRGRWPNRVVGRLSDSF